MTIYYNQTALGECGHVVNTWPQFGFAKNAQVFCDTCAREQYGLDRSDGEFILVRLVERKQSVRRTRPKPKPKPKSRWQTLLEQEGLF